MLVPIEDIEYALDIPAPQSEQLVLEDNRRLTGPGLLWDHHGVVMDILIKDFEPQQVIDRLEEHLQKVLHAVGWTNEETITRQYEGGFSFAFTAPVDCLYSALFVAETAWQFCANDLLERKSGDFESMCTTLRDVISKEANPALHILMAAAEEHGVDVLNDDLTTSLGHGKTSQSWPRTELPAPKDVDWNALSDVPLALITGTNGKTTSVRLSMAIARAAGRTAGLTSTEYVSVGDEILDRGDYSGPGGARMLLRHPRLEAAYLEVARGGILRRGLPLRHAKAALITNVAADHLGQYGINTVPELAKVKFAVHRVVTDDGYLILNADDDYVVAEAANTPTRILWFSLDPQAPQIITALASRDKCGWLENDTLWFFDGEDKSAVIDVKDIPIAMGGLARYNIRNALGAACLARVVGIDNEAIHKGLSNFTSEPSDNPGRCNEFIVNGARVFVDFAHNPHSIAALTEALQNITAKRRFLSLGHAGDRSNEDIQQLTQGAFTFMPDIVVPYENPDYLRGREPGEVSRIIREECIRLGLTGENVYLTETPPEAAEKILEMIEPGDVALLLIHADRDRVFEKIEQAQVNA